VLLTRAALSLAVGVIFYISAVNDEVSHAKKAPSSSSAGVSFSYRYGWAFFFAGASFMCAMAAAVNNISLYLRRGIDVQEADNEDLAAAAAGGPSITTMSCGGGSEKQLGLLDERRQQQQQQLRHANITTPV